MERVVLVMWNNEVVALRMEYDALRLVADGLYAMLRAGTACTLLTIAQMADAARNAARKVTIEIEQLCRVACLAVKSNTRRGIVRPLVRLVEAVRDLPRLIPCFVVMECSARMPLPLWIHLPQFKESSATLTEF